MLHDWDDGANGLRKLNDILVFPMTFLVSKAFRSYRVP